MPSNINATSDAVDYIKDLCEEEDDKKLDLQARAIIDIPVSKYEDYGNDLNTFNRNYMKSKMSEAAFALALVKVFYRKPLRDSELRHVTRLNVKKMLKTLVPGRPSVPIGPPTHIRIPQRFSLTRFRRQAPPRPSQRRGPVNVYRTAQRIQNRTGSDETHCVISGHGDLEYDTGSKRWPTFLVPAGVTLYFYTPFYYELGDAVAAPIDQLTTTGKLPKYYEKAGPGTRIYDYTLHAARPRVRGVDGIERLSGDIKIMNAMSDKRFFKLRPNASSVRLSFLIKSEPRIKRAKNLHWAACRVVSCLGYYASTDGKQWTKDTQIWHG